MCISTYDSTTPVKDGTPKRQNVIVPAVDCAECSPSLKAEICKVLAVTCDSECLACQCHANWDEAARSVRRFVKKWPCTAPGKGNFAWHRSGSSAEAVLKFGVMHANNI